MRSSRIVTAAASVAVLLAALAVGLQMYDAKGRVRPVLVTSPAAIVPASPSTVTSTEPTQAKSSQPAKQKPVPKLQTVPVPKGQTSFSFALGKPAVSDTQCPLPQTVTHVVIAPGQMVKPPEQASPGHAPTDWCNTSVWETITGGDPTLGVFPSSPSTGITFVNEHNCAHHQCPGTFITPTSVKESDRLVLTTATGVLTYKPCASSDLSPKNGHLLWHNCTDGKRPDVVNVVCLDEPDNPIQLNTVWSFRLVEAHPR